MTKRTKKEQAAHAAWLLRDPWPVVVLAVDPGAVSGAAIVTPSDGGLVEHLEVVDPMTTRIEELLDDAADRARSLDAELILALEDWGSGGLVGIKTWLGLGATRGYWRRAAMLAARAELDDVLVQSRCCVHVNMRTWRGRMIDESGDRDEHGRFHPYDSDGWKRAATRTLARLQPHVRMSGADEAEAGLIGLYGIRSDEVGRLLPDRYLRARGFDVAAVRAMIGERGNVRGDRKRLDPADASGHGG